MRSTRALGNRRHSDWSTSAKSTKRVWPGYVTQRGSRAQLIHLGIQVTKPFELYLATSPHLSKAAMVAAANAVAKWVAGEEGRLFLKDAPVF